MKKICNERDDDSDEWEQSVSVVSNILKGFGVSRKTYFEAKGASDDVFGQWIFSEQQ